jgi:hypothetical protein
MSFHPSGEPLQLARRGSKGARTRISEPFFPATSVYVYQFISREKLRATLHPPHLPEEMPDGRVLPNTQVDAVLRALPLS